MLDGTFKSAAGSLDNLLQAIADQVFLPLGVDAFTTFNLGQSMPAFPKYQKLVQFLVELKASKAAFHGMIFVRERQGVFELIKMLQGAPDLDGISFYPFTGESEKKATTATSTQSAPSADTSPEGMKRGQAQAAFRAFLHATGREVLVATSAAEEGIDVPSCEFVVCYTVVTSGRERTQRQGRAKMAKFVEFVELGTSDPDLQRRASQEQVNSDLALHLHLERQD